ncbi:MAG: hypothetical protein L6265_01740 [Thermoplasmatales archaeon]|nr:hypothetical protein [Thermoplasmatales archaeon]
MLKIEGKTVIEHLIDRVKTAKFPKLIALCTTTNPEDEKLADVAERNNIEYFRGNEKDILRRYMDAAMEYNVDFIVNVDGDDILCDPGYIDKVVEQYVKTHADFIKCEGLPFGAVPCGIKVEALKKVCEAKAESNTETGWGTYFTDTEMFNVEVIQAEKDLRHPEIRMSLDYPEDYEFFKEIFNRLYKSGKVFTLREVLTLLKENPKIEDINKNLQKVYWKRFRKTSTKIKFKK